MKWEEQSKDVGNKRKIHYILFTVSLVVFLLQVMGWELQFHVLGIILLFLTACVNGQSREQREKEQENPQPQDFQTQVLALIVAILNVLTILIYFIF